MFISIFLAVNNAAQLCLFIPFTVSKYGWVLCLLLVETFYALKRSGGGLFLQAHCVWHWLLVCFELEFFLMLFISVFHQWHFKVVAWAQADLTEAKGNIPFFSSIFIPPPLLSRLIYTAGVSCSFYLYLSLSQFNLLGQKERGGGGWKKEAGL